MNILLKHLVELIISVVVLLLIINFMFPDLLLGLFSGGPVSGKPVVKFLEEPDPEALLVSADDDTRIYEYKITFIGTVEHSGDMKDEFGRAFSEIWVVPVIDFKDRSVKANVYGDKANEDNTAFKIKRDDRTFTGRFEGDISNSHIPHIRPIIDPITGEPSHTYEGEMQKGDNILLESSSGYNLIVTLNDVRTHTYSIPGVSGSTTKCAAVISINCGEPASLRLRQISECKEDKTDCERHLRMCDGDVHIRVDEADCKRKTAEIFVEFTGGM